MKIKTESWRQKAEMYFTTMKMLSAFVLALVGHVTSTIARESMRRLSDSPNHHVQHAPPLDCTKVDVKHVAVKEIKESEGPNWWRDNIKRNY